MTVLNTETETGNMDARKVLFASKRLYLEQAGGGFWDDAIASSRRMEGARHEVIRSGPRRPGFRAGLMALRPQQQGVV